MVSEINSSGMELKVLLPFQVFTQKSEVVRISVQTIEGSFGILPNRLDCTVALVPGILFYETAADGKVYTAVDEGVLIKTGKSVFVSVRNAIGGTELGKLYAAVKDDFIKIDARENEIRTTLAKLESGFVRRFMEFHHG